MNKADIKQGLLEGRKLIQEEWSDPDTIRIVDELVAEGVAQATPWTYRSSFQCEMREITKA